MNASNDDISTNILRDGLSSGVAVKTCAYYIGITRKWNSVTEFIGLHKGVYFQKINYF
jgi:hypothetical protein